MAETVSKVSLCDGRVVFAEPDTSALYEQGYITADMHFHTNCSDSFTDVRDALALARMRGTGLAVTDHNLIESAVKIADNPDVLVIPGMEVSTTDGPHVLVYFYETRDLSAFWRSKIRPRLQSCPWLALRDCPTEKLLDLLENQNCVVSAAHPMGYFGNNKGVEICVQKGYLTEDTAKRLDAYEVICSGMTRSNNLKALKAASTYGIGFTGGTDGHMLEELGRVVTAVRASNREEFLDGIVNGNSRVIGLEKSLYGKAKMASHSLAKFAVHAPSAIHTQANSAGRSTVRGVKRAGKWFKNQDPRQPGSL